MTTPNEARAAIYTAFETAWTGTGYQYTFDNENFTAPADAPWARCAVRHNASSQETLGRSGNRRFERIGSAFIQVFTPIDQGTSEADSLARTVRTAFEGISLAGTTVYFTDVIIRETGPDGKWYQTVVEATFRYDEIK